MKVSWLVIGSILLCCQPLWAQTSSIGGVVFNDVNDNGVNDGETGISGVTVFLDLNVNSLLDGGEPSQMTDGAGAFDFTGLASDVYSVRVDESTVAGLGLTTSNMPLQVILADNQDFNDANFGYGTENPVIGAAKDASNIGRDVTLSFYLENFGNVAIENLSLDDDLDAVFGAGNYTVTSPPAFIDNPLSITLNTAFDGSSNQALISAGILSAGATASFQVSVQIDTVSDQGLGLGTYSNQVTIAGQTGGGTMVSDLSDSGNDPDPNGNANPSDAGEDDPTIIAILQNPRVGAAKNASLSGSQVTFDFYLENFGNVILSNLSLTDNLDTTFGAGNYSILAAPSFIDNPGTVTLNAGFDGSSSQDLISSGTLALGDTAQIRVTIDVTTVSDQGFGFGIYRNQATTQGRAPNGNLASDDSDEGTDPDPDGDGNPSGVNEADPTRIVIGEEPVIGVAKSASVSASQVTVDLYLENLGNALLNNVSLIDDLNAAFGMGNFFIATSPSFIDDPGSITLNGGYDGNFDTQMLDTAASTLAAGDTAQIRMTVTILNLADLGSGLGVYQNQASANATAPGGGATQDTSDNGTDPDSNGNGVADEAGENDPTPITVAPVNSIGISKEFVAGAVIGPTSDITFVFRVTNYGNQPLTNISISDDLNAVYGAGNYLHLLDPVLIGGTGTLTFNSAFNGSTNTTMVTGGTLNPGDTVSFQIGHRLIIITDQGFGLGIYQNQVTAIATDPMANPITDLSHEGDDPDPNGDGIPNEQDPTVIDVNGTAVIGIAKDAAVVGNQVTLDFYLENLGTIELEQLSFNDQLSTVFGAGNFAIISGPAFIDDPGTLTLDAAYDGSLTFNLLDPTASTLAAGDTAQIQMVVEVSPITNQGSGIGNFSNQVTITGASIRGTPVSDISDFGTDPDPNGNGNPNEAGENDATPIVITVDSPIGVAKTAAVAGNQVTVDLFLENLGIGPLSTVSLIDDLDNAFGAGNYAISTPPSLIVDPGTLVLNGSYNGSADNEILSAASTLAAGATAQIQMVVTVTTESDQGSGFGIYSNQAVASGFQTSGTPVSDLSDEGTDPDPNSNNDPSDTGEDDPTAIVISVNPIIGVAKKGTVLGTLVTLDFFVENLGQSTLTNVILRDQLNPVFGSGNYSVTSQPTVVNGPDTLVRGTNFFGFSPFDVVIGGGFIRPGETAQIRVQVNVTNVTDQGNGLGVFLNSVDITATGPDGTLVMDTSDDGIDPDPNGNGNPGDAGEDDSTRIIIGDEALIGAAKTASVVAQQVTFDLFLENFGASELSSLSLTEDLDAVFGAGNYSLSGAPTLTDDPGTVTINPGFDGSGTSELFAAGSTLPGNDTAGIQLVVDVTNVQDQGLGLGNYSNQVLVSGTAPMGSTTSDLSDSGSDPDPNGNSFPSEAGEDDPTLFTIGNAIIGAAKNATIAGNQVTLDYYVENLGTTVLNAISLPDDLDAVFGTGNYTLISGPAIVSPPRDLVVNTNFDGSSDTQLVASGSLGLGVTEQIQIVVQVDPLVDMGSGLGVYSNQVTVASGMLTDLSDAGTDPDPNGNGNPNEAGENDPTPIVIPQSPLIGSAKTVAVTGRTATVDLFLESFANVDVSNLSLVDNLDAVFGAGNFTIDSAPSLIVDPGTINLNGAFDGSGSPDLLLGTSTLARGATAQVRFSVTVNLVTDQGFGLGTYQNQVTASAQSPDGTSLADLSDDGTDPDPDGNDDPRDAGEDDPTTIVLRGSIGDLVWNDLNGNGSREGGEPGLAGISLFLDLNTNGALDGGEPLVTTDGTGAYDFTDLAAGGYVIEVLPASLPVGFVLTTGNLPFVVTITNGQDQNGADFGFQQQNATIGDFVWNDLNGDGVQDGGEPGLAGITVFLDLNSNGTLDGGEPSAATDAAGAYDFTALATGTYSVNIDPATVTAGFVLTGGALPQVVNLAAGEDFNDADFGYQQQDASIGDFAWNDLDGDGIQDGGEPGIPGLTVFLDLNSNGVLDGGEPSTTTDGAGAYDFTALATGTYSVSIDAATIPVGFGLTGGSDPLTVNLAAGQDFNDADFGFQQQDATIGDFVWDDLNGDGVQDGGEPGIAGVTVFLDLNSNGTLDGGEPSTATDGAGAYDITNIATGTYAVTVDSSTLAAGFVLTGGTNPQTVNLAAGEDFNDADFGYQAQNGSIGDFVWNDLNGDGIQDVGEAGLVNVTLDLIDDQNGNGVIDGGEPVLSTQTTLALGDYDFTGLPVGDYIVNVTDVNTVLTGDVLTGGINPQAVSLTANQDFNDADFGYQRQDGSIGDFVWNDLNGDGIQDAGELGHDGVTLDLIDDLNGNGAIDGGEPVLDTQTTAGGGLYSFDSLPVGNYIVNVTDTGNILVGDVLTGGTNPLAVPLVKGQVINNADFGYQRQDGSIGDFVWNDLNGDGVQDGGEPGFDNVTLDLIDDLNGNGAIDAGEPVLDTQTTAGGLYTFSNLSVGNYIVNVTDTNAVLTSYVISGGTNPRAVPLLKGQALTDADFGYLRQDGSIGNLVFHDFDSNGLQDAGEPGLASVTLDLIDDQNGNGTIDAGEPVVDTQTTAADGSYMFANLALGDYIVNVTDTNGVLSGFILTVGTNPQAVSLVKGQMIDTVDFAYLDTQASIGLALAVDVEPVRDPQTNLPFNQFIVEFTFRVENFGMSPLSNLSMPHDLNAVFVGTTFQLEQLPRVIDGNAINIQLNPNFDGSGNPDIFNMATTLAVGEFTIIRYQVLLPNPPEATTTRITYDTLVRVTATGASGVPVFDDSVAGEDPDPNGNGNPNDDSGSTVIGLPFIVPTLGTWALFIFMALLATTAMWLNRRNRRAQPQN